MQYTCEEMRVTGAETLCQQSQRRRAHNMNILHTCRCSSCTYMHTAHDKIIFPVRRWNDLQNTSLYTLAPMHSLLLLTAAAILRPKKLRYAAAQLMNSISISLRWVLCELRNIFLEDYAFLRREMVKIVEVISRSRDSCTWHMLSRTFFSTDNLY